TQHLLTQQTLSELTVKAPGSPASKSALDTLTTVDVSLRCLPSTTVDVSSLYGGRHVPRATCPERQQHRPSRRVLLEAVQRRASEAQARLRQLRHRGSAAQARAHRERRRRWVAEPPRCRGRNR